jgi:hypothetical protein
LTRSAFWDARSEATRVARDERLILGFSLPMTVDPIETWMHGRWEDRNWRNVPGPFYGAETDTCRVGPEAAPANVLCDETGQEFVWRQPRTTDEVGAVLDAAYQDPFWGYGWDGDDHWTPEMVRGWWQDRGQVLEWIDDELVRHRRRRDERGLSLVAFRRHLETELSDLLRGYVLWLDERRLAEDGEPLPDL